jgi:hypothetical protein
MSAGNISPEDLKRLFEFLVRFDRHDEADRLLSNGDLFDKFDTAISSIGQTKLVNALLEVSRSLFIYYYNNID